MNPWTSSDVAYEPRSNPMEPYRYYDPDGNGKPTAGLYTLEQVKALLERALPKIMPADKPRAGKDWIERIAVTEYRGMAERNINAIIASLK